MSSIASQITILTTVYSTVYSGADQRKHQSSASLAFVRGIHRGPVNSPHKWPVTRKMFPFDDVIICVEERSGCTCRPCPLTQSEHGHLTTFECWSMRWFAYALLYTCLYTTRFRRNFAVVAHLCRITQTTVYNVWNYHGHQNIAWQPVKIPACVTIPRRIACHLFKWTFLTEHNWSPNPKISLQQRNGFDRTGHSIHGTT